MRTKLFFITACLLGALHVYGQEISISDGRSFNPKQLKQGTLAQVKDITITGAWNNNDLDLLKKALQSDAKNTNLQGIDMSKMILTEDITDGMSYLFQNCIALEGITLPNIEISVIVNFEGTFKSCSELKAIINLHNFTKVNNFNYAFQDCHQLKFIYLPQGSDRPVNFNLAFENCNNLHFIYNLDLFDTNNTANLTSYLKK